MHHREQDILNILEDVCDPEVPALSILDLGIVRDVKFDEDQVEIVITPTYSGCPAMDAISMDIRLKLMEHHYKNVKLTHALSPAWTTDWMSEKGKEKLKAYGIAPPNPKQVVCDTELFGRNEAIQLSLIHISEPTRLLSIS